MDSASSHASRNGAASVWTRSLATGHGAPAAGAEQDILGCRDALQDIFDKPEAMALHSCSILSLHGRIARAADPQRAGGCKARQCSLTDVWQGVRIIASYKLCMPREALAGLPMRSRAYVKASANPAIDRLLLIPRHARLHRHVPLCQGSGAHAPAAGGAPVLPVGISPDVVCVLLQILREMKTGMGIAVAEVYRAARKKKLNVWSVVRAVLSALQSSLNGLAVLVSAMDGRLGPALQKLGVLLAQPEAP